MARAFALKPRSARPPGRSWIGLGAALLFALLCSAFPAGTATAATHPPKAKVADKRVAYGYMGRKQRLPIPIGPSVEGLEKAANVRFNPRPRLKLPPGAKRIRLKRSSRKAKASLFGSHGNFYEKRNSILNTVDTFYRDLVPGSGGSYVSPALLETNEGVPATPCQGTISGLLYCPLGNYVAWGFPFYGKLWDDIGDNGWAVGIAHEWGHGAQWWLGYGGTGYFQYVVYREAFADCMAGAYSYWMYYQNRYDAVGSGDGQEFYDLFAFIGSFVDVTDWDNHGTFEWRYDSAMFGWNQGWNGCIRWGNSIYYAQ